MNVEIPCDLYHRFSYIGLSVDASNKRPYLKCLFIERRNNKLFALVSNSSIMAIELITLNEGPDESCAIVFDPILVAECEKQAKFNGNLTVVSNTVLKYTTIKTTFGYAFTGNGWHELPDDHVFIDWQKWFPEQLAKKTTGAMRWDADDIYKLAMSSPSEMLRFPLHIDTSMPILVCDNETENWVGLFVGSGKNEKVVPAELPAWLD